MRQYHHCHYHKLRVVGYIAQSEFFTTIPSAINEIKLISSRGPVANRQGVEHPDNSTKRF
jgi:hypothetical protein